MEGGTALTAAGDDELLAAAAGGERRAWAELYERYAPAVFRFCLARLGDREAAADATQEAFAAVWTGAASYAAMGSVRAWILGIARRKAGDQGRAARRRRPGPSLEEMEDSPALAAPDPAPAVEEAVDVWAALARLPEAQQETVLLTYGLGLSCAEAGQALGIPEGTVKSRLHAARAALLGGLAGTGGRRP
jgi:RNA polymerase sigma-70 factor (ECF subfamily)